jgi:NAD(P)-dependent dehydrogenase (short-subunit alcohol dehydrogenase family)
MKHVLPRLPRSGKAVFATLSARVGSIGDNRLGGWYSYRASKAALNQLVRTAAVELARQSPEALCIAIHPGTVATALSAPFATTGLELHEPAAAARNLLGVIDQLTARIFAALEALMAPTLRFSHRGRVEFSFCIAAGRDRPRVDLRQSVMACTIWLRSRYAGFHINDAIAIPMNQLESGQVYVAERAKAIVGFAAILRRADGDTELDALFVEPM